MECDNALGFRNFRSDLVTVAGRVVVFVWFVDWVGGGGAT